MIVVFFVQAILIFLIHFIMIINSSYSGGEIGMVSLTLFIALPIQVIVSAIIYFIFKRKVFDLIYFFISWLVLELTITAINQSIPLITMFEPGLKGFVSRSFEIPSIIATSISIAIFLLYRIMSNKKLKNV